MTVQLGDALLLSSRHRDLDPHLWVVASDPALNADRVLILNLTSWRPGIDQSCVIESGEHPLVNHRTCVNYSGARITSAGQLAAALSMGALVKKDP